MRLTQVTRLVVPDGVGLLAVLSASWRWTYGSDVTVPVEVVHQDGSPYNLTGAVAAVLAFKEHEIDDAPALQVEWTITDAANGLAEFYVTRDMAGFMPVLDQGYATGIQFRDDDLGVEDTVLLSGRVHISRAIASFAQPVVVPESQEPLAQAKLGTAANYAALLAIDPASKDLRQYVTLDDGVVYYSNGTAWVAIASSGITRRVCVGAVVAGTFAKLAGVNNKVSTLASATGPDNPLLKIGVFLDSGADGATVRVLEIGHQVVMKIDAVGNLTAGAIAFMSQAIDGYVSSDNTGYFAGIVAVAGSLSTTAEIITS